MQINPDAGKTVNGIDHRTADVAMQEEVTTTNRIPMRNFSLRNKLPSSFALIPRLSTCGRRPERSDA